MLEKASQIATKPNKSHFLPTEFQLNEDQMTNNIENENTGTALRPPTPLASVENDENQTKPDNEEEDMITMSSFITDKIMCNDISKSM